MQSDREIEGPQRHAIDILRIQSNCKVLSREFRAWQLDCKSRITLPATDGLKFERILQSFKDVPLSIRFPFSKVSWPPDPSWWMQVMIEEEYYRM